VFTSVVNVNDCVSKSSLCADTYTDNVNGTPADVLLLHNIALVGCTDCVHILKGGCLLLVFEIRQFSLFLLL